MPKGGGEMPSFQEFLTSQESAYQSFRDKKGAIEHSTKEDRGVAIRLGGILLSWKHSAQIAQQASEASRRIRDCAQSIRYAPQAIHTAISDTTPDKIYK